MGTDPTAYPDLAYRPSAEGYSRASQWHPVACPQRCALERSSGEIRSASDCVQLLPALKDCDILADKAYGTKEIRTYLHDQSARYTIPPKVNTKQPWPFDKETYKRRNVIERFFNRLKEFRRAETRYDKRDDSFLAFVMVAAICVAFGILHI